MSDPTATVSTKTTTEHPASTRRGAGGVAERAVGPDLDRLPGGIDLAGLSQWWQHRPLVLALGLVWLAHIGLDQLLGYGLKYDDSFQHIHLGILGRRNEAS
jgi:hypothetical protein